MTHRRLWETLLSATFLRRYLLNEQVGLCPALHLYPALYVTCVLFFNVTKTQINLCLQLIANKLYIKFECSISHLGWCAVQAYRRLPLSGMKSPYFAHIMYSLIFYGMLLLIQWIGSEFI